MPVDASIPLQVQPPQLANPLDMYAKAMSIKDLMANSQLKTLQVQQGMQNLKNQQLLSQLAAVPTNIDPASGGLTPKAIGEVPDISLRQTLMEKRQEWEKNNADILKEREQTKAAQLEQNLKKESYIQETVREPALIAYQEALKKGYTPDAAKQVAQKVFTEGMDTAKQSGNFTDKDVSSFPNEFDPNKVLARSQSYKEYVDAQEKGKADKRADDKDAREANAPMSPLGKLEADYRAGRIDKADYEKNKAKIDAPARTTINMGGPGPASGKDGELPAGVEGATYDFLIRGTHPTKAWSGPVMKNVESLAKANGMSTQDLISASADVKSRLMAKRTFETRVQNLGRAENQLDLEIPVMEDAMKALNQPSLPVAARGKIWVLRQMGNADVAKLDQAAEVVFNEFNGIVTGNPGALNVQDVQNAHEQYKNAQTPEQMTAVISGMRRIIGNAKRANDKTRDEIMGGVSDALKGKKGGDAGKDPSARPESAAHPPEIQDLLKKYGKNG